MRITSPNHITKTNMKNVSKVPAAKAAQTSDGVFTGMLVTKAESVALDMHGKEKVIPAGSLITKPLSGGFDGRLNSMVSRHKMGDEDITFLA